MICDQFQESLELYALGVLEGEEASAISDHLSTGCPTCRESLRRALDQNLAIAHNVPLVEPPARLRRRVKEAISPAPDRARQWLPWSLAALAFILALGVGVALQTRLLQQREFAQSASADRARLLGTLQIIRAPGTREISLNDPKVHGALYVHQKLGIALVVDRLPDAPSGWKYESWLVPKAGAPRPIEPFNPDNGGRAVSVVPGPLETGDMGAVAVSMEPKDSNPSKPTTLIFEAKI